MPESVLKQTIASKLVTPSQPVNPFLHILRDPYVAARNKQTVADLRPPLAIQLK